jgi:molybdopterin molybdotransferase
MRDSLALLPEMLAPEQAIVAFFARARLAAPLVEYVGLADAWSRILARDARAAEPHPSHDRSTMDGFAVASAGGSSRRRIVGEVQMGAAAPRAIGPDETLRLPTGGALPPGADAVVPFEDVREHDGAIEPTGPVERGAFVTPAASDMRAGERALEAGRRIGPAELGVLATLGFASVPVFRRPRFGIVSTGDELISPSRTPELGQIRDSNRYAIGGMLQGFGCEVEHGPAALDDFESIREAALTLLKRCDGVVLTGGSSVGARDLVPRVVATLGAPGPIVHGIRLKPGRPTLLAAVGDKPVIGLPGNPTSALVVLDAVARPIVAHCTGERPSVRAHVDAVADEAFVGREGWTWYVPAQLHTVDGRWHAKPLRIHSAHVALLARASGYVAVGERPARVEIGESVRVVRLGSNDGIVLEQPA